MGDAQDLPLGVRELVVSRNLAAQHAATCREACNPALLTGTDAVLVCLPEAPLNNTQRHDMQLLADALASHRLTGVVMSPGTFGVVPGDTDALMTAPSDASADELWGRIAAVLQYRPLLRRMEEQVHGMQRLGKRLNEQFVEVDQELRLASRLQRDFLPKKLPAIEGISFHALYRPATWVCGDVYDVQRLDEHCLGFYLADAVGHGVAAGLLTMFIKQAVVGKHVYQDGYVIVPPSDVLEKLNAQLADQQLPNCQFVTACYGTIDLTNSEVRLSRGGHPHPVHVSADGTCAEVRTVGGLLGIFHGETFPSTSVRLEPGEKLIIYSDGMEDLVVCRKDHEQGDTQFTSEFSRMVTLPGPAFVKAVEAHLDTAEGSLQPADDMTMLVIERAK